MATPRARAVLLAVLLAVACLRFATAEEVRQARGASNGRERMGGLGGPQRRTLAGVRNATTDLPGREAVELRAGDGPGQSDIWVGGKKWLHTGSTYVYNQGRRCDSKDGCLLLTFEMPIKGTDSKLGSYSGYEYKWEVGPSGPRVYTRSKLFSPGNYIVFELEFPDGLNGTQTDGFDCTDFHWKCEWRGLAAAYPTFERAPGIAQEPLAWMEIYGFHVDGYGSAPPHPTSHPRLGGRIACLITCAAAAGAAFLFAALLSSHDEESGTTAECKELTRVLLSQSRGKRAWWFHQRRRAFLAAFLAGVAALGAACLLARQGPTVHDQTPRSGPALGLWEDLTAEIPDALVSGPFALFNEESLVAVISAHSNFMAASMDTTSSNQNQLDFGIMGGVDSIPAGYVMSHVFWTDVNGLTHAFEDWGEHLRSYYGKGDPLPDDTEQYLGYNTDNGAYYYYFSEENKTMDQTMLDVHQYSKDAGIPYKSFLLDSWWYYQDPVSRGVTKWEARPDIFPGGNAGLAEFVKETGWKINAHNRMWSNNTVYSKANGGDFDFAQSSYPFPTGQLALPTEERFWDFLFGQAVSEWGLYTYEQDWLWPQFLGMMNTMEDINLGREWLLQMGAGALKHNVTIEYCMLLPRHALQSVEVQAVTQMRVSDDYAVAFIPGSHFPQWRIGRTSILARALGLKPSKDTWYSKHQEPGGRFGDFYEPNPALQSAVATFSTGPVMPGDGVGQSSVDLIMRTCRQDGLILKPSKPMTSLDFTLVDEAFGKARKQLWPSRAEIWGTYSAIGAESLTSFKANWLHVLSADLGEETRLDVGSLRRLLPLGASFGDNVTELLAYEASSFGSDDLKMQVLDLADDSSFVELSQKALPAFEVWHFAPILENGVAVLGELGKWVPMSPQRIESIDAKSTSDVSVVVDGAVGENVTLWFAMQGANGWRLSSQSCVVPPSHACTIVSSSPFAEEGQYPQNTHTR